MYIIVNDIDSYIKLVENFDFICAVECDDVLIAVHKTRSKVQLDKFNYIVFVLIENAKLLLYKAIKKNILRNIWIVVVIIQIQIVCL